MDTNEKLEALAAEVSDGGFCDAEIRNGYVIQIGTDDFAEDPRRAFEPFGSLVVYHRNLDVSDPAVANYESALRDYDVTEVRDELFQHWNKDERPAVIFPVTVTEIGSGEYRARVNTSPVSDRDWNDANGLIWVSRAHLLKEMGRKRVTKRAMAAATRNLKAEIAELSAWLSGDVFFVHILDADGEVVDGIGAQCTDIASVRADARATADRLPSGLIAPPARLTRTA